MAAERAEDAALSEEQLDAAVGQLEEGNAGPAMRATLAAVSGKVTTQSNGKVTMRAESQDEYMWVWGVCRLVSASPKTEVPGNVDGWRLPPKDIDSGEMFCAFGTGAEHKCLVSFQAPHRGACGRRGKTRGGGALEEGTFDARGGTQVAFKDGNGAVVRGVIMSLMLYIPPTKGTARAVVCGEQMVIFAFVYVAVRFTWQIVVLHGRLNLVPVCSPFLLAHRSCLLAAQTIYEDKNVEVEGFPKATVIDGPRLLAVNNANPRLLVDVELALDNLKLWQLCCVPGESVQLCEQYGVDPQVAETGKKKVEDAWSSFFDLFLENPWRAGEEPQPMRITITKNLVPILKFNETRTAEDEVTTEAEELMKKLGWLDYTASPAVKAAQAIMTITGAIEDQSRARAERQSETSVGAERRRAESANEEEMLKLNDDDYCDQFCEGGRSEPKDVGRMQLARLLGEKGAKKVPVPEMVKEGIGSLWFHFAKIVLNTPNKTPEWFPTPNIKDKFCRFVALLTDEGLPPDKKWTGTMVTKAQNAVAHLLQERNDKLENDKPKQKRKREADNEAEEDSEGEGLLPLQRAQRRKKSPTAQRSRPATVQAPFAPMTASNHAGRTQNPTSRESQAGSSAGGGRGGGTGLATIQSRVANPVGRPGATGTAPPRGTEVVHGDEVDPIAYDINQKADRMLSLINSSKDELVEKIQTLSDRVSAAQTTGSGSVAVLENKLHFAMSAIKLLLAGAKSSSAEMNISKMAARMMMETRVVGADGFTKKELDELFGKPEQAVQQNETAQPK